MRKTEELFFKVIMLAATILVVGSFFAIVGAVLVKGLPAMNLDMITKTPSGGFYIGKAGGILNAIIGSLYITIGATFLAAIISIPITLYINVHLKKNSWLGIVTRFSYDVLFGIPSIVYGAFGFTIMVWLGMRASLLGGIITVTLLIIPVMIRTTDEVMRTVPKELLDATYALGATRLEAGRILLKQISSGIVTALLLSFGRAVGDAATVLFTAGFSDNIPTDLGSQAATLPLAIFFQLSSPQKEVQARAYASALILTILVLFISILSRVLSKRFSKNKI